MNARLRLAVLTRDGYACVYCGRRPPEVMLDADHVIPRARGGATVSTNLVSACAADNQAKSDRSLPLPLGYVPEPVGFQRRGPALTRGVGDTPGRFRWCEDACPECDVSALPTLLVDGDAHSIQLAYRCPAGHQWHSWFEPHGALIHAQSVRWEAAHPTAVPA